jgi:hypothetical protein
MHGPLHYVAKYGYESVNLSRGRATKVEHIALSNRVYDQFCPLLSDKRCALKGVPAECKPLCEAPRQSAGESPALYAASNTLIHIPATVMTKMPKSRTVILSISALQCNRP